MKKPSAFLIVGGRCTKAMFIQLNNARISREGPYICLAQDDSVVQNWTRVIKYLIGNLI